MVLLYSGVMYSLCSLLQPAGGERAVCGEQGDVPRPQQPPEPLPLRQPRHLRHARRLRRALLPHQPQPHLKPLQLQLPHGLVRGLAAAARPHQLRSSVREATNIYQYLHIYNYLLRCVKPVHLKNKAIHALASHEFRCTSKLALPHNPRVLLSAAPRHKLPSLEY